MSETLRELVVSLSLNSDNFSRNIKSVNQQIKEAESAFKLAASGVKNFEGSQSGTSAKLDMLRQKQALQAKATQQYEMALQKASGKLQKGQADVQKYSTALTAQQKTHAQLKAEIDRVNAKYKEYVRTLGESDSVSIAAKENLDALQAEYKASGEEITKLQGKLKSANASIQNSQDAVSKAKQGLNEAKAAMNATGAEIARLESRWTKAGNALTAFSGKAAAAGAKMGALGRTMSRYVTAPLIALGVGAVKASIDFESAFAGVRKTVDASEDEYGRLAESIKRMSTEIATDTGTIAGVMENAGQLGIKNENLESFTRTMVDLGNSTNLAADEAATAIAQFANITGMAQGQFRNFGSSLVDLGNNFATTESDIMNMASRLAASGSQVGLTQPQILGFATALSSVGLEAEAGGTAFSKAMVQMQVAVETGGQKLKDFSRVSGLTTDQFKALWESDPAGAIESFIVGLSRMDEQGVSSIVTLEEMGLKEVRLRDTLLRATNATELFASAQKTANTAWKENSALTNEAEKRYATTESKLKNLKNSAVLAGQQIGDDLNPMIQDAIGNASGLVDSFMALDKEQRMQIVQWAAIAAAAGPAIAILGKGVSTVGKITGALGKFSTSVGSAGGGLKGLVSVIGGSKLAVAALAAAAVVGVAAWYDYASGAKAAREATEAMMKTAEEWKNTQAKTIFDTGNDPLGRFGLSKESFSGGQTELEDWLSRLTETWTDGKKESNEIVKGYVDEFTSGTDKIREAIKARQRTQEKYGVTGDQGTEDDLKKLAAYDKEVEALLKKRKNGKLTEDDQTRLEQIIQERVELQLKYTTGEGGSYESLAAAVEAEKARLAAENKTPGADLYGDALTGAAQGYQTQVDAINQSYRDQYADIMAITDEKEREAALTQLNLEHTLALKKAQEEYNAVVGKYAPEAFETPEIKEAADDMEELKKKLAELQSGEISATAFEEFTKTLDEGKLASYVALLKQMQESGGGDTDLGDGSTANKLLADYQALQTYIDEHPGLLTGLGGMLGATGEEANRVLVDMALTPEGQTLKDWLDGNKEFTLNGTLTGLPESVTIDATAPVTLTNIPDSITVDATSPVTLTGLPDTVTFDATAPVTLTGLPETITINATAPTTLTGLPDQITVDATSPVTLTNVPESLTVEADAPVTITGLPDGPLTIPANSPTTLTGLPDGITIEADAPVTLSGVPESLTVDADAPVTLSGVPESLTVSADAPVTLTGVPESLTVDAEAPVTLTGVPGSLTVQAEAPVTLTNVPEDIGIPSATIQSVGFADGVTIDAPTIADVTVKAKLSYDDFSGIEQSAIDAYFDANPTAKPNVTTNVGFQTGWAATLKSAFDAGNVEVFGADGAKLDVTPEVIKQIGPTDIFLGAETAEDGTVIYRYQLLPKVGTKEAVDAAQDSLNEKPDNALTKAGLTVNTNEEAESIAQTLARIDELKRKIAELKESGEIWDENGVGLFELEEQQQSAVTLLMDQLTWLTDADYSAIAGGIATILAAMQSGEIDPEAGNAMLQPLLDVIRAADQYLGVGNDISAGIASGMKAYGWSGDASTLATSIETAIRAATQTQSPSQMTVPIGTGISEGIGEGITAFSFAAAGSSVRQSLLSELSNIDQTGWVIGRNFSRGLANGITSGESWIKEAARKAALAAKKAAEDALKVASPSKVGFEIGGYFTKGIALGVESEEQLRLIRNAARYLSGALQAETASSIQYDNRRTYQHQEDQSVTVNVEKLAVRDQVDIRALAMEISALKKQINRGKGG